MTQELDIRHAELRDITDIHNLVAELARYEKSELEFTCSTSRYEELYKEKLWNAIVACHDGAIIGVCIYYYGFSTWKGKFLYLEDFIVSSSYRRKGVGQSLFDQLVEIAVANNCQLMRWQVLDWNMPTISFYKKYQVIIEDEWLNCKLPLSTNSEAY